LSVAQKINRIKLSVESGGRKNALNHQLVNIFLFKRPYFRSIEDIRIKEPFQFRGDFKKEFRWLTYILENYIVEINNFIELKNEYEKKLIIGDLDGAHETIVKIENNFGISLWSIENTILLIDLAKGSEANWSALSTYLSEINNSIYDFNINAGSKRVESSLSYESFLNQFQNDIDNIHASGLVKDYFVFKNFNLVSYEY